MKNKRLICLLLTLVIANSSFAGINVLAEENELTEQSEATEIIEEELSDGNNDEEIVTPIEETEIEEIFVEPEEKNEDKSEEKIEDVIEEEIGEKIEIIDKDQNDSSISGELETSGVCGASGNEANVSWKFDSSSETLTISGDGEVNGLLPWNSFKDNIKSVKIIGNVSNIPESAFESYSALKYVIVSSSVKKIGNSAFNSCSAIEKIVYTGTIKNFNKVQIGENNSAFDKNKVIFADDGYNGKYIDITDGSLSVDYQKHTDYKYVGWFDISEKKYFEGTPQFGKDYIAHWTKDGRPVVTDTISVSDISKDESGYGWTYKFSTKTIVIENANVETGNKPIADLGNDNISLTIKSEIINCNANPVVKNNGSGKFEIVGGTYNFKPTAYLGKKYREIDHGDGTYSVVRRYSGGGKAQSVKVTIKIGSDSSRQTVQVGDKISTLNKPSRDKKVFVGWYSDEELTNRVSENDTIKDDTTLYAKFKWNPKYTINMKIDSLEATAFEKEVLNDVAPIIRNDRTMLPARFVAENLGAKVTWNAEKQTVTVVSKDKKTTITLAIGSDKATINKKQVNLDSCAFIEDGRTYTPVRFIAEALGATVDWIGAEQEVVIVK